MRKNPFMHAKHNQGNSLCCDFTPDHLTNIKHNYDWQLRIWFQKRTNSGIWNLLNCLFFWFGSSISQLWSPFFPKVSSVLSRWSLNHHFTVFLTDSQIHNPLSQGSCRIMFFTEELALQSDNMFWLHLIIQIILATLSSKDTSPTFYQALFQPIPPQTYQALITTTTAIFLHRVKAIKKKHISTYWNPTGRNSIPASTIKSFYTQFI